MIALLSGGPAISTRKWCRDFRRVLPFAREKDNNVFLFPFLSRFLLFCFSLPFFFFSPSQHRRIRRIYAVEEIEKEKRKNKMASVFLFLLSRSVFVCIRARPPRPLSFFSFLLFFRSLSHRCLVNGAYICKAKKCKKSNAKRRVASLLFHLFFRLSFRRYSCTHNPF